MATIIKHKILGIYQIIKLKTTKNQVNILIFHQGINEPMSTGVVVKLLDHLWYFRLILEKKKKERK